MNHANVLVVAFVAIMGMATCIALSGEASIQSECASRAADLKTEFRWDRGRGCRLGRGDVYVPAHLAELAAAGITEIRQ